MREAEVPERPLQRLTEDRSVQAVRSCLGDAPGWIVGGAIRDALLGITDGPDLDLVVDGDLGPVLACLGEPARSHQRFGTASLALGERVVDLARARTESYSHPGALPDVRPAGIDDDLQRRDFSINAIALPLEGGDLSDPCGGAADLAARRLRLLHPGSVRDDPTRALRAARYAARLGFEPDADSEAQIRAADLATISRERVCNELALAAIEPQPEAVAERLARWGVIDLAPERIALIGTVSELLRQAPWVDLTDPRAALVPLLLGEPTTREVSALIEASPGSRWEIRGLGDRHRVESLVVALASGASWIEHWPQVRLEALAIGGDDLIAAGVEPGPALGIGLRTALRRRIDGEIPATPDAELQAALEAAGEAGAGDGPR